MKFPTAVFSILFLSAAIVFVIFVMAGQSEQTDYEGITETDSIIQVDRKLWNVDSRDLNEKICRLVETARNQLSEEKGKKYWRWYGYEKPVDWCGCFVSWCLFQAGLTEGGGAPKFSYCQDGVQWFSERGLWMASDSRPQAGMVVFFDWDGNGVSDHTGIVSESGTADIIVVEGDSGDRCRENTYDRDEKAIMGYGFFAEKL